MARFKSEIADLARLILFAVIAGVAAFVLTLLWYSKAVAPYQTRHFFLWLVFAAAFVSAVFSLGVRYGRSAADFDRLVAEETAREASNVAKYARLIPEIDD